MPTRTRVSRHLIKMLCNKNFEIEFLKNLNFLVWILKLEFYLVLYDCMKVSVIVCYDYKDGIFRDKIILIVSF